jgi:proteasome lid subunit RPN8/RPN11
MSQAPNSPPDLAALVALCRDAIAEHRDADSPNEAVGLVWADGSTCRLVNEDPEPTMAFRVNRHRIMAILNDSPFPPVALYHTHAGEANPSLADSQMLGQLAATNPSPTMLIFGSDGLRAFCWHNGGVEECDLGERQPETGYS